MRRLAFLCLVALAAAGCRSTPETSSLAEQLDRSATKLDAGTPTTTATEPASSSEAIREMVERLGGAIEVDETAPGRPVIAIDLNRTEVTDADLALLASAEHLQTLDLRLTGVSDTGIVHLQELSELRFVNLFRTKTGDAALRHLSRNRHLETLLIGGTGVTDDGLRLLSAFPKLRKLSVFDTGVGDAGARHLAELSGLKIVLLGRSNITQEGTQILESSLPGIRFQEP